MPLSSWTELATSKVCKWLSLLPSLVVATSLFFLATKATEVDEKVWTHLWSFVLWDSVLNTLILIIGVGLLSLVLGVGFAVLVSFYDFPGRSFFSRALVLPLIFPGYVLAFVWIGILEHSGPLQSSLRSYLGSDFALPEFRSTWGIILILSLSLYPYIYFLTRQAFMSQGRRIIEAGQTLGLSLKRSIWWLAIPSSRPWIFSGLALVLMESIADFGVATSFNYDTLTILIYRTWFSFFSIETAAQLSFLELAIVFLIFFFLYRRSKFKIFEDKNLGQDRSPRKKLGLATSFLLGAFLSLSFVIPCIQLLTWSLSTNWHIEMLVWVTNSFSISLLSALSICIFASLISLTTRFGLLNSFFNKLARIANFGYAVPGTIFAVSLMIGFTYLFGPFGTSLSLSLLAMIIALSARNFAVGFQPIENSFVRVPNSLDEAARTLGQSKWGVFKKVHVPLFWPGLVTGFLLVFLDVFKEMPIQVMLRPTGWESLSTKIYQYTVEAMWNEAAAPAFLLVVLAAAPSLWLLQRKSTS